MMKVQEIAFVLFVSIICLSLQSCLNQATANPVSEKTVPAKTWLSLEEGVVHAKQDQKKILIDVYTDWCKWCKVMDKETFGNAALLPYLKENFHLVKLNAEQKEPIKFNGKEYNWIKGGRSGYNQLAIDLLDGQLAYPSLVVFDAQLNKLQVIRGYKSAEQLKELLR